jgi:hypothetical protein
MEDSIFQKRIFGLFLLVVVPVGLFVAFFRNDLTLLAGPVLIVLGVSAWVISFVPTWVGTDPATGNAPPSSPMTAGLLLGGVLLNLLGLSLVVLTLTAPPPPPVAWHAVQALVCPGVGFVLVFGLLLEILPRYVLPAQTRAERRQVRGRLWLYLLGAHGPVVIVRNGQQAAPAAEKEKMEDFKPSVAVLDTVSAIALERKFPVQQPAEARQWRDSLAAQLYELEKYLARGRPGMGEVVAAGLFWVRWLRLVPRRVLRQWLLRQRLIHPRPARPPRLARVEGPGLVFIEADERVRATLDLRTQLRTRPNVKALTRDGIEVRSTLTLIFRLQGPERHDVTGETGAVERNRPAFTFHRESAFRAVYGSPVAKFEPDDEAPVVKDWTDLAAFVASDIYRDLMLTRTLDDLFHPTSDQGFPLDDLRREFSRRVKIDPVLRERGIHVESADFGRLTVPEKVAEQRLSSWKADWVRQSVETLASADLQRARIIQRARTDAQYDLTRQMLGMLQQTDSTAAVLLRFIQALEQASADPTTRRLLPNETIQILNNWMNHLSRWLPSQPSWSAATAKPAAGPVGPETRPGPTPAEDRTPKQD